MRLSREAHPRSSGLQSSRGCDVQAIVDVAAITAVQALAKAQAVSDKFCAVGLLTHRASRPDFAAGRETRRAAL
jgi:hypothetical protein